MKRPPRGSAPFPYTTFSHFAGSWQVTKAPLSVTADNASKVYGQANPAFTVSYSGFVNGDGPSSLAGTLSFATTATAQSHVGSYDVTPSGLSSSDYNISFVKGTLAVTPAPLTITASSGSSVYGSAPGPVTASYSGFQNGDTAASLSTQPTCTTAATAASHVGSYATSCAGAASNDYTFSYVAGSWRVTKAPLTVTADDKTKVYEQSNPPFTVSYSGFVNGDGPSSLAGTLSFTTAATAASHVGSYDVTPSGLSSSDYNISFVKGTLAVTPANLTITADNKTKVYGQANPSFTVSYSGFVNGDSAGSLAGTLSFTTTATAQSHVGSYDVTPSGLTSTDYNITLVKGTLT